MGINKKKGVALVAAVFIVLIMFIISTGVLVLIRKSVDDMDIKRNKTKLFYAAEGGLNHALRKLRMSSINNFAAGNDEGLNGHTMVIDGIHVTLQSSYSAMNGWTISSIASRSASPSGKSLAVKNTLSGIRTTGLTNNAVAMASDMNKDLEFASGNPNDPGSLTSSQDMIIGNQYFGGVLNIDVMPVFDGVVNSASKTASVRKNEAGTQWYYNGTNMTRILKRIETGRYSYGIWDKTDGNSYKEGDAAMTERMSSVFPSGYNGNQPEVDFLSDVVETYTTLKNMSTSQVMPTGYSTADVTVTDNKVKVKLGTTIKEYTLTSSCNMIVFPSNYKTVNFNECVVGSDVTFVLETGTAVLKGDIYYKGMTTGIDDKNKAWGVDNDNIETLRQNVANVSQKFGLIAYQGNVTIDSSVGDKKEKIVNDHLLLNGGFYCPNGQFGANSPKNASKFTGSKRVINVGSILIDTKGLYRSGTQGITAVLTGDYRYSRGIRPVGFKQLIVQSPSDGQFYIIVSDDMNWSSENITY